MDDALGFRWFLSCCCAMSGTLQFVPPQPPNQGPCTLPSGVFIIASHPTTGGIGGVNWAQFASFWHRARRIHCLLSHLRPPTVNPLRHPKEEPFFTARDFPRPPTPPVSPVSLPSNPISSLSPTRRAPNRKHGAKDHHHRVRVGLPEAGGGPRRAGQLVQAPGAGSRVVQEGECLRNSRREERGRGKSLRTSLTNSLLLSSPSRSMPSAANATAACRCPTRCRCCSAAP